MPARKGGNEPAQVFLFADGLLLPIPAPQAEISSEAALEQLLGDCRESMGRQQVCAAPVPDCGLADAQDHAGGSGATQRLNDVSHSVK